MKNLQIIFNTIRRHSGNAGIPDEQRFAALEKLVRNDLLFFPLHFYLQVLQCLGLIKLSRLRKGIVLTEKGASADISKAFGTRAYILFMLLFIRRLFSLAILFILFWPMYVNIEKQYNTERHNGCQS